MLPAQPLVTTVQAEAIPRLEGLEAVDDLVVMKVLACLHDL